MAIYNEFMPQEQGALRASEAKRRLAQALRQQGQAPQGQMVGGIYVAPSITQYLASGLNQYQGNRLERDAMQQEQDIYTKRGETIKEASKRFAEALKPREMQVGENVSTLPFEPSQMDRFGSPMQGQQQQTMREPIMQMRNPTPQDIFAAQSEYGNAIGSPDLMLQAAGQRANYDIGQQTRQDERAFRSQEAQLAREQRMQELLFRSQDNQLNREQQALARKELVQMNIDARREMASVVAANRQPQAPVSIMGADGQPVLVPPQQAYGQRPYNAKQEAADVAKVQQQEQARISAQQAIDQAALLYGHEGRKMGTGMSSFMGAIPASSAKDFQTNLETFKAQTFIPMVSALKGMGALSDAEGKKLAASVGALDPSMSEKAFQDSLKQVTKTLYDKAKASGLDVSLPEFAKTQTGNVKKFNPQTGRIE